ncbi:MAG: hypothetical protein QXU27_00945, partial [Candidatus Anstonellales archaeon]
MEKQIGNEIKIDESRIAQEIAQELKNINPNNVDRELLKKILGLLEDKEIKINSRIAQEIAQELKNINPNNVDRELLKKILGLLEDKNYPSSSNESQIEINDVKP